MAKCNPQLKEAINSLDLLGKDSVLVGATLSDETKTSLSRALSLGADRGSYLHVSRLPKVKRQEISDSLFGRDMETSLGLTSNQTPDNVDYFGTTTKMKPLNFLKSAAKRGEGISNKEKRKDFAYNIAKKLANDKEIKLGPPKLWLDIRGDKVVVVGHEGRHRADAIRELLGDDVNIPVDIQFTEEGSEFRARHITNDILNFPVVSEDGKKLSNKLTTMYGIGLSAIIGNLDSNKQETK